MSLLTWILAGVFTAPIVGAFVLALLARAYDHRQQRRIRRRREELASVPDPYEHQVIGSHRAPSQRRRSA